MQIQIISPGKVKEKWLQAGISEFVKRLSRYCTVTLHVVADTPDSWPVARALEKEAEQILRQIKPASYVVALDLNGQQSDSEQFSCMLMQWLEKGGSEVIFVIGGSNGLSRSVLDRAQDQLCLSRLTFTHQMARLILLEQCYRAFRIQRNEPYHK